ncbi:MAG: alpha/beta hydrolase [Pseudomonadota bacterium]
MRILGLIAFAVLAAFWASRLAAQDTPAPIMIDLERAYALAEIDPPAALDLVDDLLDQTPDDAERLAFELLLMRAEILREMVDPDAADAFVELAEIAEDARDVPTSRIAADWDPISLYEAAIAIYLSTDDPFAAADLIDNIIDLQRDAGASADAVADSLLRKADIIEKAGETDTAAEIRTTAEETRAAPPPTRSADETEGGFRTVKVFYATDRARTGKPQPDEYYGNGRGELEMGVANVTVPYSHTVAQIEEYSVFDIFKLEFGPNPAKHMILKSVTPVAADGFFADMNATLSRARSSDAFVFVHGYNVTFDAAAKRAAQMTVDIDFPGIPILYSWPSAGRMGGYFSDAAVVRLSGRRLARFLEELVDKSEATTIHLIAHSMGNRAMTDALELLALRRNAAEGKPIFNQVIFAAPDVDAELFSEMMPTIRPVAKRFTLYANENDWALFSSKSLHGRQPRAGQGGADLLLGKEFDSLDMSVLGEDMLAHSYFAGDQSALADLAALFWRDVDPARRCGLKAETREGAVVPAWRYETNDCSDSALVEVIAHLRAAGVTDAVSANRILARVVKDSATENSLLPIVRRLLDN